MDLSALELRLARSAKWFYWDRGLSLVNAFAVKENFGGVQASLGLNRMPVETPLPPPTTAS